MKILHLISDHQVIERAMDFYERVFPCQNEYLIFPDFSGDLKHIKKRKNNTIVNYSNYKKVAKEYDFNDVKYVIAHYMSPIKIEFIKCIPLDIHVCWEIYGGDLYNQFLIHLGFDLYYTNPEKYKKYSFFRLHFPYLFSFALECKGIRNSYIGKLSKMFEYISKRTNSLGVCSMGDKQLLEKYSGKTFSTVEVFNFSLNDTLGDLYNSDFSHGSNVLIGNSASVSNNHLYILDIMKDIRFGNKVILPVSYGGFPKYKEEVCRLYKKRYGKQLEIISDYMPLSIYNEMFLSVGIMIMASWRQESWGNIVNGLYLGIKIYMSEKNSFYQWLNEIGFIIFSIEKVTIEDFNNPLTLEQKQHNRSLILERYNDKRIENNFRMHFR